MMSIRLIDVPMDLGAGRRGVDMGPSALRLAGIREKLQSLGFQVEDDQFDILVPIPEHNQMVNPQLKFLPAIRSACKLLAERVELAMSENQIPVVMGGDHSIAIGTIAGLSAYYRKQQTKFGVIWIDAHADMNTPDTSPSGNIHGMPLAVNLGLGDPSLINLHGQYRKVDPDHVVLIGIRDVDIHEKANVKKLGVHAYTMENIDRRGIVNIMDEAIDHLKKTVDAIHISFDVDGLDPELAPGVGTPVKGGLNYREAHVIMELAEESELVRSIEITEINPILDVRNQTAEVAVDLVASALGKKILH